MYWSVLGAALVSMTSHGLTAEKMAIHMVEAMEYAQVMGHAQVMIWEGKELVAHVYPNDDGKAIVSFG